MSRLVEYVLAVGVKHPKVDTTQSPELIRRFPETDHADFPLPLDVVFFCQPEACASASKKISLRETNSFVFTLTDKETGITRYGICCNFFRPCIGYASVKKRVARTHSTDLYDSPGSFDELDQQEAGTDFQQGRMLSRTTSLPTSNGDKKRYAGNRSSLLCYSLTSLCIVSQHPFFSTFRECLFVLRKLIESQGWIRQKDKGMKRRVFQNHDRNQNFRRVPLVECRNWSVFFNIDSADRTTEPNEMHDIDHWINQLLKIPQPVPGINRVEVELLPRHVQPPLTFALPEKSRFTFLDFPVHLPLELLGVETCLKVLTCIMLEHKVRFVSLKVSVDVEIMIFL